MAKPKEKPKEKVKAKAKSVAKKPTPADPAIVHVKDLPDDSQLSISGGPRSKGVRVKCGGKLVGDITRAVVVLLPREKIQATCEYHPPEKNLALREEKKATVDTLDVSAIVQEINTEGWPRPDAKASQGEIYAADLPENARVEIFSLRGPELVPTLFKARYGTKIIRGISSLRITIGGGGLEMRSKVFIDCRPRSSAASTSTPAE